MVINNIVNGKTVDEKNIQTRIQQMRTFVSYAEKTWGCHHTKQRNLIKFANASTEEQMEMLKDEGYKPKAHIHGDVLEEHVDFSEEDIHSSDASNQGDLTKS